MDAFFCSSRGLTLEPVIREWHAPRPEGLLFQPTSSAKLQGIQHDAYDFLAYTNDPTNCHIYYIAGLCDITLRERRGDYEEVYLMESIEEIVNRMVMPPT